MNSPNPQSNIDPRAARNAIADIAANQRTANDKHVNLTGRVAIDQIVQQLPPEHRSPSLKPDAPTPLMDRARAATAFENHTYPAPGSGNPK